MRHALLALAGIAAGLAATLSQPAFAQRAWWSDPMNQQTMDYLEDNGQVQASPIPGSLVEFPRQCAPGTIVISTSERGLYFVTAPGEAIEYGVGVGRPGFEWS